MIKNMKKLIAILFCSISLIQASDALNQQTWSGMIMDKIGQSGLVHAYSTCIQAKIDDSKYGKEPASQKYQDLGLEAQQALGIPFDRCLPIVKIDQASFAAKAVFATAQSDAIYVNEDLCEKRPYGSLRSTMFHEAVHAKYHDKAMRNMLGYAGFFGGFIGTYAILKKLQRTTLRKSLSGTVGAFTAGALAIPYHRFMEQRADMQGHQATNCSSCVLEEMQHRTNMYENAATSHLNSISQETKDRFHTPTNQQPADVLENFECYQGYLHRSDLQKIAQSLGDKKCSYHLAEQK